MKIGVIGGGTVGRAVARAYLEHVDEVRVYDLERSRATHNRGDTVGGTDLVFVCLPETALSEFFASVTQWRYQKFVVRSTVPVGHTRRLSEAFPNVVHSPEFLTARCAVTDAQLPARNIIGVPCPHADGSPLFTGGNLAAEEANILYHRRFPAAPVLFMSSNESELVKLACNAFFAVKVAFFNELRYLCDEFSWSERLRWDTVLPGILSDGRISHSHTDVPGPDGKRGYGGACLPKDLRTLLCCMATAGTPAPVLAAALTHARPE